MMLGVSDRQNIRETRPRQGGRQEAKDGAGQERRPTTRPRRPKIKPTTPSNRRSSRPSRSRQERPNGVDRIPQRPVGGDLRQAHRRDDRRAQEQGRAGVLGRPAVDPRHQVDRRRGLSQRSLSRARRARRHHLCRRVGRLRRRGRQVHDSWARTIEGQMRRLRSSDGVYFTKAGARKLAHYVEREIAPLHEQSRDAGGAADRADRRRRRRRQVRRCGRSPARWCR